MKNPDTPSDTPTPSKASRLSRLAMKLVLGASMAQGCLYVTPAPSCKHPSNQIKSKIDIKNPPSYDRVVSMMAHQSVSRDPMFDVIEQNQYDKIISLMEHEDERTALRAVMEIDAFLFSRVDWAKQEQILRTLFKLVENNDYPNTALSCEAFKAFLRIVRDVEAIRDVDGLWRIGLCK